MKRIKKILASLMVAVMVLTAAPLSGFVGMELNLDWLSFDWLDFTPKASAATYSGKCGANLTWSLDTSTGELIISGTGAMNNYSKTYTNGSYRTTAPWGSYISLIKKVTIGDSVTSIGDYVFYYCTSLTSITIPDSVTSIGSNAFYNCSALENVYYTGDVAGWCAISFYHSISNPMYYADNLYIGGELVTELVIPDSVTSIGGSAFYGCTGLTSVTIPDSITSIGGSAFYGCSGLTSVTIPDSVTSIGGSAFYGCTGLTSVTIPDSVTSIGSFAFYGCDSLNQVNYDGTYDQWKNVQVGSGNSDLLCALKFGTDTGRLFNEKGVCGDALEWILYADGEMVISGTGLMTNYSSESLAPWTNYKAAIKTITIKDGVTRIGNDTFVGCINLTSVSIAKTVKKIGNSSFRECTRLESINFPDCLTGIGHYAFYGCTALTSISFPKGFTSMGNSAFEDCVCLTEVALPDSTTSIGANSFSGCTALRRVLYSGTLEQWESININGNSVLNKYVIVDCNSEKTHYLPGSCGDNVKYTLYTDGTLVISGSGQMYDYTSLSGVPWSSLNSTIKMVTINEGITTIGSYSFSGCDSLMSITIPDSVTSIGSYVFQGCTGLTSITIPDSVTSIGSSAFYGCDSLTSITIPDSVTSIGSYVFQGCTGLTSITIPDSITSIGASAFYGCTGLANIAVPYGVTSIGNSAFYNCTGLTSITIPDSVTNIGAYAFGNNNNLRLIVEKDSYAENYAKDNNIIYYYRYNESEERIISVAVTSKLRFEIDKATCTMAIYCTGNMVSFASEDPPWKQYEHYIKHVIINDGCTSISYNAFKGFEGLESVAVSASVTSIGENAFSSSGLKSIIIPANVTDIGGYAFYNCSDLTDVTIASGVTSIGNYAFADSGIVSITIPNSVTSLGEYVFNNCANLKNVTIGNRVTKINSYAFADCVRLERVVIGDKVESIGSYAFQNCSELTNVEMPNGMTSIGYSSFNNCTRLASVTIPDTVNKIGYYAFRDCTSLVSIVIPDSVLSIGDSAFRGCAGLTEVTIGNKVKSIGHNAFRGCTKLEDIKIPDSVTSMQTYVFHGCTGLKRVIIGEGVSSIQDSVFYDCSGIEELVIPASAKIYNSDATFYNCINIKKVTFTKGTGIMQDYTSSTLNSETYYGYTPWYKSREKCTEIIFENGVTNIGDYAFYGGYSNVSKTIIPDSITSIGDYAFYEYTGFASMVFPESVTSVGDCAFYGCTALESLAIPYGMTEISDSAFYGCTGLKSVTISDSVTSIGDYAFFNCSELRNVTLPISVQSIGNNAFKGCKKTEKLKVYNRNCAFADESTGYYTTVCGYEGSTAQTYALNKGYDFELISDDHEHIYSTPCDPECNICGHTRTDLVHTYSSVCDITCDLCNYTRTDVVHTYSNSCDPECDVCGYTRTEITHTYDNDCDTECNYCDFVRTPNHTDDNNDGLCDVCEKALSDILVGVTQNFKVKVGETVYIKFVPANSGVYTFFSSSSTDTYGYIFNADKNQLKSDDDSGDGNNFSITYTFKSGTVYYLGVRYYSSSNSGEIPVTIRLDELICDHNNTREEHKDSTCTENGYDKVVCDDCGEIVSTTSLPLLDHDYKTITAPPTCVDEGTVVCLCRMCRDAYISEILDPLGHSELVWVTVKVPSTRNEGIMNQVCPACGEVFDTKTVPAISLSADSIANIDFETNTISGFDSGSSSIDNYLSATNNGYTFTCKSEKIVTGTVITLTAGEDTINEFEAVIFGDTNGDGWYDGQDAIIVDCLANGMLTKEDVGEAVYMAADCNHDGVIDQLDVDLLNQAGALLSNVDQSKPTEVLLETSAEYVEYLDLIDQSPEIEAEDDTDIPEADTENSTQQDAKVDIFEMIMNFIKSIFEMLISYIPMPLK